MPAPTLTGLAASGGRCSGSADREETQQEQEQEQKRKDGLTRFTPKANKPGFASVRGVMDIEAGRAPRAHADGFHSAQPRPSDHISARA